MTDWLRSFFLVLLDKYEFFAANPRKPRQTAATHGTPPPRSKQPQTNLNGVPMVSLPQQLSRYAAASHQIVHLLQIYRAASPPKASK